MKLREQLMEYIMLRERTWDKISGQFLFRGDSSGIFIDDERLIDEVLADLKGESLIKYGYSQVLNCYICNITDTGLKAITESLQKSNKSICSDTNETPHASDISKNKFDKMSTKRFEVALSFPGEHRDLVQAIAEKLAFIYSNEKILYDKFHRFEFARPNLDTHLQNLYKNESEIIVVFICADYNKKIWCGIEWRAIRELLNSRIYDDRIIFVKCKEGLVDGVFGTIDGYIDSAEVSVTDIVNDIVKRRNSIGK